jgi:hypothetical protein
LWWQWRILNGEGRQEGGGTEARMLVGLRPMPPAAGATPSLLHLSLTLLLNSLLILTFLASFLLLPACLSAGVQVAWIYELSGKSFLA